MCRLIEWVFLGVALWNLFTAHRTSILSVGVVLGCLVVAALFGLRADVAEAIEERRR